MQGTIINMFSQFICFAAGDVEKWIGVNLKINRDEIELMKENESAGSLITLNYN